ncbi:MAG: selenocysteine-specific translation elongation factor [Myxococcota bacterium]|nr:selenocysteine-specific translation elongation factor [Myxococcota bacterium]
MARERPAHLILGTAGHIDHGKTALVRALTGVDTDRLPEEKTRGITIDLGFAPLDLPDGARLSVVDVPGHERLVRNMVAGATGIDLLLLVVAADEGVMPQTREHLAICELLGLSRGVVALTKTDLVDDDVAGLAEEEVRELLAAGPLRDAPILRVSSQTGAGVEALRTALAELAAGSPARTPRAGVARLAVDRAFTVRGFGSVVTGTLVGGAFELGQGVEIHPGGRRARVRGLQSHGVAVERAEPGVRTAVNLQGIELADVGRGALVAAADAIEPTRAIDAEVHWLPAAAEAGDRASVEFLAGTSERRARVAPIGEATLAPGATLFARIHLEGEPLPLLPGDRFVLQGFARTESGGITVGGGTVLDVAPPRRRRSDPTLGRDLGRLRDAHPADGLRVRVERAGLSGVRRDALRRETGMPEASLSDELAALEQRGEIVTADAELCLSRAALSALCERADAALAAFHAREPLRPGLAKAALAGALPDNTAPAAVSRALEQLVADGRAVVEDDLVRLASHRAELGEAERELAERVRADARAAALEPPTLREWSERLGVAPDRLRELLAHLEREGALRQAPGELWFDRAAVDALRERVVAHLHEHEALETPAYKALIGTSRKHAVPLMELFDSERLTLRVDNRRVLRGGLAARGSRGERGRARSPRS